MPLLIVHGDRDAIAPYAAHGAPAYAAAQAPKILVTLLGGTHTGMVDATAELFDALDHADEVGCAAIAGAIDTSDSSLTEGLIDPGEPLLMADCPSPCEDAASIADGMGALRQTELVKVAVRAFLEGQLVAGSEGMAFLLTRLGPEHGDVTVDAAL
jgi:hypothetical protein